jgi:uncharacterized protein YerC
MFFTVFGRKHPALMQRKKKTVDLQLEQKITLQLYQLLSDLRTPEESKIFLQGLLTDMELNTLVKRIAILYCLQQGWSYEQIREQLKVSSATIASLQGKLNSDSGVILTLRKIHADEWAGKWSSKIMQWLGIRYAESSS